MRILQNCNDIFLIEASRKEVYILINCILNLDNLCGEGEFRTYVGATKAEAMEIMNVMHIGSEPKKNPE